MSLSCFFTNITNVIVFTWWLLLLLTCFCLRLSHLNYRFRLFETMQFRFCIRSPPGMLLPPDCLLEYRIEQLNIGPFHVRFIFSTKIFYREVPGFASDCSWSVWCRVLTTWLMYIGLFLNSFKWQLVFKFNITEYTFLLFLIVFMNMYLHICYYLAI